MKKSVFKKEIGIKQPTARVHTKPGVVQNAC